MKTVVINWVKDGIVINDFFCWNKKGLNDKKINIILGE